jgi:hypothetical protein
MAKIQFKGKVINYNPVLNEIIIKFDPLDPSLQQSIEYITNNYNKFLTMSINYNVKDSIKDSLRRVWYLSLHKILLKNNIYPTADKMMDLDNSLRESIFPVIDDDVLQPKRMRDMSNDELRVCVDTLFSRYPEIQE